MLVKCDVQNKEVYIIYVDTHKIPIPPINPGMNECFCACEVFVLFAISHQNADTPLFIACAFIFIFSSIRRSATHSYSEH